MEGVRHRLAEGVLWTGGGRILANVIGAANTLVLARLLTPADFGLVAMATVAVTLIGAFTELSLAIALIQRESPTRGHYDTAFTMNVIRALGIGLVVCALAWPVAAFYDDPRLAPIMLVLAFATFISGMANPKLIEFRRRLSFGPQVAAEVATKVMFFVTALAIALVFKTYWAIVIGSLAAQILGCILSYALIPFLPRLSLEHWRELFSFSSWLMLSKGVNAITYRGDQLVVGAVLDPTRLGYYSVGDNLASIPVREATAPLAQVLFPAFARLQDSPESLRQAYLRAQSLLAALAIPAGIGFALIALPAVDIVLGAQWEPVVFVIQMLTIVYAMDAFSSPFASLALGLGRTRLVFIRDIINLVVRYPIIIAGLLTNGLEGAVIARCAVGLFGVGLDCVLAGRLVRAPLAEQFGGNWRALCATALMAAAVASLGHFGGLYLPTILNLALLILTGALTYAVATIVLWFVAGRPPGPEHEALEMLSFVRRRFARA